MNDSDTILALIADLCRTIKELSAKNNELAATNAELQKLAQAKK